ncbi:MAG: hypothetical protein AAB836_00440 [Patescibacteria group bacterium]
MAIVKEKFNKLLIDRVVTASSRIEGINFKRAKANKAVIIKLKKYGRGFSI